MLCVEYTNLNVFIKNIKNKFSLHFSFCIISKGILIGKFLVLCFPLAFIRFELKVTLITVETQ